MKRLFTVLLVLAAISAQSQNPDSVVVADKKPQLVHVVNLGYLFDRKNESTNGIIAVEVMSGLDFGRFGAALGVGVDQYVNHTAMPFFMQLHFDLKNGNLVPYYFAKGGVSKVWKTNSEFGMDKPKGGLMLAAGIGVRKRLNGLALNFSAGYQMQRMNTASSSQYYWDIIGPWGGGSETIVVRKMHRLVIKMGVLF